MPQNTDKWSDLKQSKNNVHTVQYCGLYGIKLGVGVFNKTYFHLLRSVKSHIKLYVFQNIKIYFNVIKPIKMCIIIGILFMFHLSFI